MSPELLRRLNEADLQALAAGDMTKVSSEALQLLAGGTGAKEETINAAKGMNWGQRALANVGAGMADLGLGVQQLYTDLTGTDEEKRAMRQRVEEKRALDKRLAEESMYDTPFGKYLAQGLQVAGNVAPTLVIPAGGAVQSGRLLPLAARSAATGAGLAAINPLGENDSRAMNMATGAALSAALPLATAAVNSGRRMVTRAGGAERAGEQVAQELAEQGGRGAQQAALQQTLDRLRNARQGIDDIPLSTAAQIRDPQMARIEAGSRARNGANWYDFDQGQARAVSDAVQRATSSADDVATRRALRSNNRAINFEQAMSTINEPAFLRDVQGFRNNLETAMRSPEASDPAVRSMLEALRGELERLGPDFRPEHLATIRANLASKAPLVPQNAYQAAPRSSPATMSVLREVDNILNNATNNRWQRVVSDYARDSDIVRASQAAGKVREAFWDSSGQVKKKSADAMGDVPIITESGLRSAINSTAGPQRTLQLSNEANTRLNAIVDALRAQGIVQGVKRSATAGGGSNTASDMFAARAANTAADALLGGTAGPAAPVAKGAMQGVRNFANARRDAALAEALQNPERMIALIEQQLRRGEPLTPQMEYFLRFASGAPAASLSAME